MKQLLSGKKIIKTFGVGEEKHRVLNEVSVTIGSGEFVSIMGPSGSGKSTLLYALSGMDGIDSGEVAFEGRRLSGLSDDALSDLRRNRMGFVFQQPTLLKNLNILDNIILPQTRDRKRNVKQLTAKARLLMRQMGIEDLEERDITQASGGQLQRAGICRALMGEPGIVFGDEPTGSVTLVQHYPKQMPVIFPSLSTFISSMTERQRVRFSSRVKVSYIALKSAVKMFLTAAKSGGASCTGSGSFSSAAVYIS